MITKVFFLSSHGFGHIVRTIPMIKEILDKTNDCVYIACDLIQIDFLRKYLNEDKRVSYSIIKTDVGFVNLPNSFTVDVEATETKIFEFINSIDHIVNYEITKLKQFEFNEIYCDISPIGILVGSILKKKVILMTNFTWYVQYKYLNLNKDIIDYYYNLDTKVNKLWTYPLSLPLDHIKCERKSLSFVSRTFNNEFINNIRKDFEQVVIILSGMSAKIIVNIKNYDGLIIHTEQIKVNYNGPKVVLHKDIMNTHDYIKASDLVVTKAGWTTVSECVCANVKMLLIERPSALEDTHIINEISKMGLGLSITEEELSELYLDKYIK
ncbi:MAG: hypothetical protein K0Q49_2546 [Haloplasmataceae bacterium]|jgi:hypothetical protein|nr:hypothetical protein [Haloplasmataceae bacterium]